MQRKYSELFIEPELEIDTAKRQRASYVRKTFYVSEELESAVIKISACGLYKAYINGVELDKQCFCLASHFMKKDYNTRNMKFQKSCIQGKMLLTVIGDGWYRGRIGLYEKTNFYGEKIKLFCILHLKYKNGTEEEIVTDTSWKATQNGPIGKNDLKTGKNMMPD